MCADANITQFYIDAVFVEAEGVFKWSSTNETISYINWAPNEPNNLTGNEQCVQMFGNVDGSWNDVECSNRFAIVCQIPGAYLRQHAVVSAKVTESCIDVRRMISDVSTPAAINTSRIALCPLIPWHCVGFVCV